MLCGHLEHILFSETEKYPLSCHISNLPLVIMIHSLYPVQFYFHTGLVLSHHAVVSQYYIIT